jgi:hypothetical protein
MALSKDWTLQRARGILRVLIGEISEQEIQDLFLDDVIHLAVCDLAELLGESQYNDYGTLQIVTQTSDVIDVSTYRIDTITKLVDATNGYCVEKNPRELEGLAGLLQTQGNIYWSKFGTNIYLYKPTALTYGTLTLYYNRVPTKATADGDFLDIRDKYAKLAIDKAKILLYEMVGKAAPETLTGSVNNAVQQIRQANREELEVVKSTKSRNN